MTSAHDIAAKLLEDEDFDPKEYAMAQDLGWIVVAKTGYGRPWYLTNNGAIYYKNAYPPYDVPDPLFTQNVAEAHRFFDEVEATTCAWRWNSRSPLEDEENMSVERVP